MFDYNLIIISYTNNSYSSIFKILYNRVNFVMMHTVHSNLQNRNKCFFLQIIEVDNIMKTMVR